MLERESLSARLLRCYYSRLETLHSWLQSQNSNAWQEDDPASYRLLLSKTLLASFSAPSNGSTVLPSIQEDAEQVNMLEVGRELPSLSTRDIDSYLASWSNAFSSRYSLQTLAIS
jgi:hypothetical protein